jgi:hypothetical protein
VSLPASTGPSKTSAAQAKAQANKQKGPKSGDLAEICGGMCTLQAFNGSKDEKTTGAHHAQQLQQSQQAQQGDDQTRFRSRQAS